MVMKSSATYSRTHRERNLNTVQVDTELKVPRYNTLAGVGDEPGQEGNVILARGEHGGPQFYGHDGSTWTELGGGRLETEDDGVLISDDTQVLNFTGSGVVVTDSGNGVVQVNVPTAGGGAPSTSTFLTSTDESVTLPNSRQILAGQGTTVDTGTANQISVDLNVTGSDGISVTNVGAAVDIGNNATIAATATTGSSLVGVGSAPSYTVKRIRAADASVTVDDTTDVNAILLSAAGGGGAPVDAQYVTLATDATLTDERVLTGGTGITIVDGGAGGNVTLNADGVSTAGGGDETLVATSSTIKELVAGSGVTLSSNATTVTIDAVGGGSPGNQTLEETLVLGNDSGNNDINMTSDGGATSNIVFQGGADSIATGSMGVLSLDDSTTVRDFPELEVIEELLNAGGTLDPITNIANLSAQDGQVTYNGLFPDPPNPPFPVTVNQANSILIKAGNNTLTGAIGPLEFRYGGHVFIRGGDYLGPEEENSGAGSVFINNGRAFNGQSIIELRTQDAEVSPPGDDSGNIQLLTGQIPLGAGGHSGEVEIRTGQADGGASGKISLDTGNAAGQSGQITLTTGEITSSDSGTGIILIRTGNKFGGQDNTNTTGEISIQTGTTNIDSPEGFNNTGPISIGTGTSSQDSGVLSLTTGGSNRNSGAISMHTGGGLINTGSVNISSGISEQDSGDVMLYSGVAGTSPAGRSGRVEINTGIADTSGEVQIHTGEASDSGAIAIETGTSSGVISGEIRLGTGTGADANSGGILLETGEATQTGAINLGTGNSNSSPPEITGNINLQTGSGNGTGSVTINTGFSSVLPSGKIELVTGDSDISGDIDFITGNGNTQSGNIKLETGLVNSNITGTVHILTGNGSVGNSGAVLLETGDSDIGTGNIRLTTGDSTTDVAGNILLHTGTTNPTQPGGEVEIQATQPHIVTNQNSVQNVNILYDGTVFSSLAGDGNDTALNIVATFDITPPSDVVVCQVDFGVPFSRNTRYALAPRNANTALSLPYISSGTNQGFELSLANATGGNIEIDIHIIGADGAIDSTASPP